MGDLSDMNDCERFLRSSEGQAHLEEIVAMLKGRTIISVTFSNEVRYIATTLHLDDGGTFLIFQPSLDVDALREQFAGVLEREYHIDHPKQKPRASQPTERRPNSTKHSRLIPLTKWNEYHEWPPIGGLRHLVFHAKANGFAKVIRKVGRRVLIDEDAFFEWVQAGGEARLQSGASPSPHNGTPGRDHRREQRRQLDSQQKSKEKRP